MLHSAGRSIQATNPGRSGSSAGGRSWLPPVVSSRSSSRSAQRRDSCYALNAEAAAEIATDGTIIFTVSRMLQHRRMEAHLECD